MTEEKARKIIEDYENLRDLAEREAMKRVEHHESRFVRWELYDINSDGILMEQIYVDGWNDRNIEDRCTLPLSILEGVK